jgi:hypothetical protein
LTTARDITVVELNGFAVELSLLARIDGDWLPLADERSDEGFVARHASGGIDADLSLTRRSDTAVDFRLRFTARTRTRLRLRARLLEQRGLFHLIPGNVHGDNNAAHARAGEFPCLAYTRPDVARVALDDLTAEADRAAERNRAPLWEFRADRASHPVSILCCDAGAVGVAIDPYSPCDEADDGVLRNGIFAALPDSFGVSLGYGNDPLTFVEKTKFRAATADCSRGATAAGTIYAFRGDGRRDAHRIIRALHERLREVPVYTRRYDDALRALAESFRDVNWSPELRQYTNRHCRVPIDTRLAPWRAIVEIGWTGGSVLGYPFMLAEHLLPGFAFPKSSRQIFDEICAGWNEASGLINDTALNTFTQDRPEGWNDSTVNGWWSGFVPQTRDNHCAYTTGHAAYYLLRASQVSPTKHDNWLRTALGALDTVMELQRGDGAFGYVFSTREPRVIDFDGFAGCWFAAALPLAWQITGDAKYGDAGRRAFDYYHTFVQDLACWGTPMDTYKSIDSEGNLAFIRAARLMHELTRDDRYLTMLRDGAHYEYLWRYGFRTRPQCPPLKGSSWNSCGGTITSVSNPHVHPMGVVATSDLEYLARATGDDYHQRRADDGMAWLMNTMELYPDVMGYGRYGVLSERTCPSDGLLVERYADDGTPASTWWSYNAWAAANAMEAIAERLMALRPQSAVGHGGRP